MADQVFESPYQWNLYSSAGRTSLGGTFLRTWRSSKGGFELILAEISIRSLWMNRSSENISFHNLPEDFTVTLSQVIISRQHVEELIEELDHWLDSPRELSKSLRPPYPNDQDLKFNLRLAEQQTKLENATCEVEYSGIAFPSGTWSFGVDQSCIRIFVSELRDSLEKLGRAA